MPNINNNVEFGYLLGFFLFREEGDGGGCNDAYYYSV